MPLRSPKQPPDRRDAEVARLHALRRDDPEAAAGLAAELVRRERAHRILEPALAVLAELARPDSRSALRARFFDLTEHGTRHDQDCSLRIAILRVLRKIGSPADRGIAELAAKTVQMMPPGPFDVAQTLRAEGLLLLADLDPARADYYAVELLHDPNTSGFSYEPMATAVRVLAAGDQVLPLWSIARRPGLPPDVLAQAFASFRRVPEDLQLEALRAHLGAAQARGSEGDPLALVVAEAIIRNRLEAGYPTVIDLLKTTTNLDLYRYLAFVAAHDGDTVMRTVLLAAKAAERDSHKAAVLSDALG